MAGESTKKVGELEKQSKKPRSESKGGQERRKKRRKKPKFVDALEELPANESGTQAESGSRPPPAVPALPSSLRTTAASPIMPRAATAAVAASAAASKPAVLVDIVILPSPVAKTAATVAMAGNEPARKKRKRSKKKAVLKAAAAAAAAAKSRPTVQAAAAAAPPAVAPAAPQLAPQAAAAPRAAAPVAAADTCNLRKAWSQADATKLARIGSDRAYLQEVIPEHPRTGDLDWELISRHFGRYSKDGAAVRTQYGLVKRMVRESQQRALKGTTYTQLVKEALLCLPHYKGTVLDIQKYLKRFKSAYLDKYKNSSGSVRWKKAVGEVLRKEKDCFEQVGKSGTKIIWHLKPIKYD